jgi:ribosomal-protein-alanine N-acetyltransferase
MSADRAEAVRVERMRWWDLEAVGRIEADRFGDQAWSAAQLWAELARVPESRRYVVARSAGEVVGYAGLFLVRPEADVQTIAVARGAQGRGIGRALLTALADQARTAGADVLHLEVRADNAAARSLYAAFGFGPDGRRRDYYGPGCDAVLMSLRLAGDGPRPGGADA